MKAAIFAAAAVLALTAADPAAAETRRFNLRGFDQVAASDHIRLIVREGDWSVRAENPEGDFRDLVLEVRDGTLVATRPNTAWNFLNILSWGDPRPRYTVYVTAPRVSGVRVWDHGRVEGDLTGPDVRVTAWDHGRFSGDLSGDTVRISARDHGRIAGGATAETLDVEVWDHGDFIADVDARDLQVSARDHGGIALDGRCGEVRVRAWDRGRFDGRDLACETADIDAWDGAEVSVWTRQSLNARARDGAEIGVRGEPAYRRVSTSDRGRVSGL